MIKKCVLCKTVFTPTGDKTQKYCSSVCKKRAERRRYKKRKDQGVKIDISLMHDKFAKQIAEIVANDPTAYPNDDDYDLAERFIKVIKLRYNLD